MLINYVGQKQMVEYILFSGKENTPLLCELDCWHEGGSGEKRPGVDFFFLEGKNYGFCSYAPNHSVVFRIKLSTEST